MVSTRTLTRAVFLTPAPLLRTQLPSSRPLLPVPLTHPTSGICRCGSLSSMTILILFLWRTASALHSSAPHHLLCEAFLDHTIFPNLAISLNLALLCASQSSSTKVLAHPASSCQRVSPSTVGPSVWSAGPPPASSLVSVPTNKISAPVLLPREASPDVCVHWGQQVPLWCTLRVLIINYLSPPLDFSL